MTRGTSGARLDHPQYIRSSITYSSAVSRLDLLPPSSDGNLAGKMKKCLHSGYQSTFSRHRSTRLARINLFLTPALGSVYKNRARESRVASLKLRKREISVGRSIPFISRPIVRDTSAAWFTSAQISARAVG